MHAMLPSLNSAAVNHSSVVYRVAYLSLKPVIHLYKLLNQLINLI